jgi:hypothetical protein
MNFKWQLQLFQSTSLLGDKSLSKGLGRKYKSFVEPYKFSQEIKVISEEV